MTQSFNSCLQILTKICSLGPRALVVFDLDSTLFDVSPRTQKIVQEFAQQPIGCQIPPQRLEILRKVQIQSTDWGYREAFLRAGLSDLSPEFHDAVQKYWTQRFFHGDYLHHDRPVPGAVPFVQQIHLAGARIVYLTGRHQEALEHSTLQALQSFSFPQAELVLKSDRDVEDAEFKAGWFGQLDFTDYEEIYFFENEPVNLEMIERRFPKVQLIFVDRVHSGMGQVSPAWLKVLDFTCLAGDEDSEAT